MKKIFLALLVFISFLFSDITKSFPTLEGRVVDTYGLLNNTAKHKLSKILEEHENQTSNQIVVVILKSLDGYEIADYSYQLGRHWGIGQKDKNNGVLLVASINDRKLRIEVGYGLEGALTDKISHEIIEYTLKPKFRASLYEEGINSAIEQIIQAIKGEYVQKISSSSASYNDESFFPILFFVLIFISMITTNYSSKVKNLFLFKIAKSTLLSSFFAFFSFVISQGFTQYNLIIAIIMFIIIFIFNFLNIKKISTAKASSYSSNSYGSSGGFGSRSNSSSGGFSGGFSGGGGGFGGGGASGGW